ncbi:MAG: Hpt domain-containing protein [Bacteroidetes bacterium]|jgi:HPt (histidine-containing phosphotransfer) domain-containing protein|nr:MAG: Hpt domain-containing protein [Bacteroidota bacterium]
MSQTHSSNTHPTQVTYEYLDSGALDTILDLMDGDTGMVIDLVDTLAESSPELMSSLEEGVRAGNASQIQDSAHSLKSSNAQLGAMNFAQLCQEIELMGKARDLSRAPEVLDLIRDEFLRVEAALQSWKNKLLSDS